MAYRVFWQIPQQVLYVELEETVSVEDFIQINQAINDHLGDETTNRNIALIVDMTRPDHIPRTFAQLKASQTYVLRRDLRFILVVGSNKVLRLITLLIFNLCRPRLMFFDTMPAALTFLDVRYNSSSGQMVL